jgi:hypothetical protein
VSTVQVITAASTDWPAIVAAAVTGLTAIAGIAGTAWLALIARREAESARDAASRDLQTNIKSAERNLERSNSAAEKRAIQAQKMRIYAEFHGALDDVIAVARRADDRPGEFGGAHSTMLKAAAEVVLVGPDEIGDLTDRLARLVSERIGPRGTRSDVDPSGTIDKQRKQLIKEMKADLATYKTVLTSAAAV